MIKMNEILKQQRLYLFENTQFIIQYNKIIKKINRRILIHNYWKIYIIFILFSVKKFL